MALFSNSYLFGPEEVSDLDTLYLSKGPDGVEEVHILTHY